MWENISTMKLILLFKADKTNAKKFNILNSFVGFRTFLNLEIMYTSDSFI